MKKLIYLFLLSYNIIAFSQVGIGTTNPDSSSALDITSTDKGVLIPRVNLLSTTDTTTITSPANSLLVYNLNIIADVVPGFYYWNGTKWISISDGDTKWSLTGNAGTNASTNFIGTTDNTSLQIKVNNVQSGLITGLGGTNLFLGYTAGLLNTGILNAAFGHSALKSNTSGNNNIAMGYRALGSNTSGSSNVAIGTDVLTANTTSSNNIGIGYNVLQSNVASDNIAIGLRAAFANTSGSLNIAMGSDALRTNTTGTGNIGIGHHALFNTTASDNIAIGPFALDSNTTGQQNIGIGLEAIGSNVSGSANTAMGFHALTQSTTANNNNAFGYGALGGNIDGNRNTAMGRDALLANVSGSSNTALGYNNNVGANNLNNTTTIGANAFATVNNALVLGSISGTNGATDDALVGIGTTAPTAKLHINSASSNAFRLVDGNQAAGRVMTSDANGNATWATPALSNNWRLTGNAGTSVGTNFIGTTDNTSLQFRVNNIRSGLISASGAGNNLFFGYNVGTGISGIDNVGLGYNALLASTFANRNTAIGARAAMTNTTGNSNTVIGTDAFVLNTIGSFNACVGGSSLSKNIIGNRNTAIGVTSLLNNLGDSNTAVGNSSGDTNTLGNNNTFLGTNSDCTSPFLSFASAIGSGSTVDASYKVRIGSSNVTVCEVPVAWTVVSDKNLKSDIRYDVAGLNLITKLQPATYVYKAHGENAQRYTGLLAQDVEATLQSLGISSSIVTKPNADGTGSWGIRYAELTIPLIKAVQELSAENEALKKDNETMKAKVNEIEKIKMELEEIKALLKIINKNEK